MQQKVKCFSEAKGLPEGINWEKATSQAKLAAYEIDEGIREEELCKGEHYDCAWYTYDKTLKCQNTACHVALNSLSGKKFLLNVPLHYQWGDSVSFETARAFYDWMNDPIIGLWRSCMQDAVILVDDDNFPIGTLWPDVPNTPIYPLVHYCLSTRWLTEHVEQIEAIEDNFKATKDIHLAFLLALHFVGDTNMRKGRIWHSSYQKEDFVLPNPWVVPPDFTETIAGGFAPTVYVNEKYLKPNITYTSRQDFIKKYHMLKEKNGCWSLK